MRTRLSAVILAGVLLLAGCVSFPESGPVSRGIEGAPEPEAVSLIAEDPQPGDPPDMIVRGFLHGAAAGATDDFTVARQYLTDSAAAAWNPGDHITVYSGGNPQIEEVSGGRVEVTVDVSGTVDDTGVYTPAPVDASTTIEFSLVQDEQDQWRIAELDDGVAVSEVIFGSQYRQVPLYFLSPDADILVSDTRWYPQRNAPTAAMRGLLEGPVDWLDPGVFSAIPGDTALSYGAVTVSSGTAQVDLTEEAYAADSTARQLIRSQVEHTLLELPQVQRVEITVDGAEWDSPAEDSQVAHDPTVGRTPVVLDTSEQVLATFSEMSDEPITPIPGVLPLGDYDPQAVARGYDEEPAVMLAGTDHLLTVPTEESPEPVVLAQMPDLLAPSYDRHGWVWTAPAANTGELLVVRGEDESEPQAQSVAAEMLTDADLRALRVSRDGTRLAVIATIDDVLTVEVHSIVRGEDGAPIQLEQGVRVARQLREASTLVWVDEQHLAVLGVSGTTNTVHLSPVGGPTRQLPTVPDAITIASARGDREMYAATDEGDLYARSGPGWRQVAGEVAIPTFPG